MEHMTTTKKVLIVGGGIAGMALAIALSKKDIQAEIVERKTDWTVLGVGIIQQSTAMRALKAIGLLDRCLEKGFAINALLIGDAECRVLARIPQPQLAGPEYPGNMGIMRPALHTVLADASREVGTRIRLGLTVSTFTQDANGI